MIKRSAVALAALAMAGCQAGGGGNAVLDSDDQKASYAIGVNVGRSLEAAGDHIHLDQLIAGINDMRAGGDLRLEDAEMQSVMAAFNQTIQAEMTAERDAAAQTNLEEGTAFLAENGAKEGVVTTASGLQYEVLREGEGASPASDDSVILHYRGTLLDGTEFDASYGGDPANFSVGGLIPGFSEALLLMNPGSHYRVVIPSDLAYGPQGTGADIGPNATLIFEIEMLEIAQ